MITSPKNNFLSQPEAKQHFDLVANNAFRKAVDAALLQYQHELSNGKTLTTEEAASNYNKIAGAVEFVRILFTIADKRTDDAKLQDVNLNFRA